MTGSDIPTVINAAGKLTALGGSAQSEAVAAAQSTWARRHVDLARLRATAGSRIAEHCGAEAGCVTSGAAAGIAICVAAIVAGTNLHRLRQLPFTDTPHRIALQAGHSINFGATIAQMICMGGATPLIVGSTNSVSARLLADTIDVERPSAMLYVQSHHCVQANMVSLDESVAICRERGLPVIVDAAAEGDLRRYVAAGADLVTYSGGKAFGGPTSGFVVGRAALIEACEMQFEGIARPMKVGKEAILGLLTALDEYVAADEASRARTFESRNRALVSRIEDVTCFDVSIEPDDAGRPFTRVAIRASHNAFDVRHLARHLADGSPSIRTRNHHLDQGLLLVDPRELHDDDIETIAVRLREFAAPHE